MQTDSIADTIYFNGTVLTMAAPGARAEAVATKDGRILAVGARALVERHAGAATRRVDLAGRTMLPGLIDPHSHFPDSGEIALFQTDLNAPPIGDVTSIPQMQERLRARAATTPVGEWVVGYGYDDTIMVEGRHPTAADLDAVSRDHPIWCSHLTGHFGVANSLALALAGLGPETPQPQGGYIHADPLTGKLTGRLDEPSAMDFVTNLIPARTLEEFEAGLRQAGAEYAARGITCAQNSWCSQSLLDRLACATGRGNLPIRLIAFPDWRDALAISEGRVAFDPPAGDMLIRGAAKIFADGSIQGYTGYLTKPYHTLPKDGSATAECGYPIYSLETLHDIVDRLYGTGWQIAIHGNGDAAIDDIISAHRAAQGRHGQADMRHIVVHAQMAREDQLDAMQDLGLTPSFFSLHIYYWGDRHRDIFIGPERAARISPAGSAVRRGMRFTIHCDTPVVPMTPLKLMACAVDRKTASGRVLGADQCIDVETALRAHTIDAAWQMRVDDLMGSIEPGKLADFVVFDREPAAGNLEGLKVVATILGDRLIHDGGLSAPAGRP